MKRILFGFCLLLSAKVFAVDGTVLVIDKLAPKNGAFTGIVDSSQTVTNTANFNNNLSGSDTDVQKALDTIDNLSISGGGVSVYPATSTVFISTINGSGQQSIEMSDNESVTIDTGVNGSITLNADGPGGIIFQGAVFPGMDCSGNLNSGKLTTSAGQMVCADDISGDGVSVYNATATVGTPFGISASTITASSITANAFYVKNTLGVITATMTETNLLIPDIYIHSLNLLPDGPAYMTYPPSAYFGFTDGAIGTVYLNAPNPVTSADTQFYLPSTFTSGGFMRATAISATEATLDFATPSGSGGSSVYNATATIGTPYGISGSTINLTQSISMGGVSISTYFAGAVGLPSNSTWYYGLNNRFWILQDSTLSNSASVFNVSTTKDFTLSDSVNGTNSNQWYSNLDGDYTWGQHVNVPSSAKGQIGFASGAHGADSMAYVAVADSTNSYVLRGWHSGSTHNGDLLRLDSETTFASSAYPSQTPSYSGTFGGNYLAFYDRSNPMFRVGSDGAAYSYDSTGTEYIKTWHNGSGGIIQTNTDPIALLPKGGTVYFYNDALTGLLQVVTDSGANVSFDVTGSSINFNDTVYMRNNKGVTSIQDSTLTGPFSAFNVSTVKDWTLAESTTGTNSNQWYSNMDGNYSWGNHVNMPSTAQGQIGYAGGGHADDSTIFTGYMTSTNSYMLHGFQAVNTNVSDAFRFDAEKTFQSGIYPGLTPSYSGTFSGNFLNYLKRDLPQFKVDDDGGAYSYDPAGTEYVKMWHNGSGGIIQTNAESINLLPAGGTVYFYSPNLGANLGVNVANNGNVGFLTNLTTVTFGLGASTFSFAGRVTVSSDTTLNGDLTVREIVSIGKADPSSGSSLTFDPEPSAAYFTLNQKSVGSVSGGFSLQQLGQEKAYVGAFGANVFTIGVATTGTNGTLFDSTPRIQINDRNSSNASISFNPSNHGFVLGESSMTFDSGSSDPVFEWQTDGELNLSSGDLQVNNSSVCREDGTNCPVSGGGVSVYNATATIGASFGMSASTITVSSITVSSLLTMGNVIRISTSGLYNIYGSTGNNDAARGRALERGVLALNDGETILVGPATYYMLSSLRMKEGSSIVGIGRPVIYDTTLTDPIIIVASNNVTVEGLKMRPSTTGIGLHSTVTSTATNVVIRDVEINPNSTTSNGIMWSQISGGGTTVHWVDAQIFDSVINGGSITGFGVYASLTASGKIRMYDCDVFGATDGILFTGDGDSEIYGGKYRSVLDAMTSSLSHTMNIFGSYAQGDQADIYSDDGAVNVFSAVSANTGIVGNNIKHSTLTVVGDVNLFNDDAYSTSGWDGSTEVPTKNAVRDKIETLSGGSVLLTATQTFSGANTFTSTLTYTPAPNLVGGLELKKSSITFDSGSSDPVINWATNGQFNITATTTNFVGKVTAATTQSPAGGGLGAAVFGQYAADIGSDTGAVMTGVYGQAVNIRTGASSAQHAIGVLGLAQDNIVAGATSDIIGIEGRTIGAGKANDYIGALGFLDYRGTGAGSNTELVALEARGQVTTNGVTAHSTGTLKLLNIPAPTGKGETDNTSWSLYGASTYAYYMNGNVGVSSANPVNDLVVKGDASSQMSVGLISAGLTGMTFENGPLSLANYNMAAISPNLYINRPTGGNITFLENNTTHAYIEATTGRFVGGTALFVGDVTVPAEAYGTGWNGSNEAPTKNDVYDKIETLGVGYVFFSTAPYTNTSTFTLKNIEGLRATINANTTYFFDFVIYSSATAATTGLGITVSTQSLVAVKFNASYTVQTGTTTKENQMRFNGGQFFQSTASGGPGPFGVKETNISGNIVTGNTGGNIQVMFVSEVNASAVTVMQGSYGKVYPLISP